MISPAHLIVAGLMIGAFGFGHHVARNAADAELSRYRETAARQQAAVAEHASRRLVEAQAVSDQLTADLAAAAQVAAATQEKLDVALRRVTTGRTCLAQPALRVLDGAHNLSVDMPAPVSGAAAEDAPVATDTDIAVWIARTGKQYDECRNRLAALIDWHTAQEPAP